MILRSLLLLSLICSVIVPSALAGSRELTAFSDGFLIEIETVAKKGIAELTLPGPIRDGTLRVKPLDSSIVGRVELLPVKRPDKLQQEINNLTEQKNRLEDRMKALDTREDIFAAAVKSQSSKAPRKTKTNPDPIASVRQGTSFAIAQLEAVYTARRRTEQELKQTLALLANLTQKSAAGPTIRVVLSQPTSRIRVAAVLSRGGWTPHYDIHVQGDGTAHVTMLAALDRLPDGFTVKVAPSALSAGQPKQLYPHQPGNFTRLFAWQLPLEQEQVTTSPLPVFSFTLKNNSGSALAAGQASLYYTGEYIGTAVLPAIPVDSSATLTGPR
jgi:hypothetical protein